MRWIASLMLLAAALGFAAPAHTTGGLLCRTAGAAPVELSLGFGHVPGSPLIVTRLIDRGRTVPVSAAQWWLDDREVRLVLVGVNAFRQEVLLRAKRNGRVYDGQLWRNGARRWVRCREG